MKLLILGGSNSQFNAIKRAKEKGHTVIVSDYYKDAPGKSIADYGEDISTFDVEKNIQAAQKHKVDGVMTIGTDQPVYTCARVAETLGLPCFIDSTTAKAVTNKKIMKKIFTDNNIPTVKYRLLKEEFTEAELKGIKFPVVVKPLDSQGQRGVFKLDKLEDVKKYAADVLAHSREKEFLLEEFYENGEITVNGWVVEGEPYVFSIVDRISHNQYPHIGVCIRHNYPSKFMKQYYDEIIDITKKIVSSFKIHNGPIYFQMFVGHEGIKVNEIACRIGGAYEDQYMKKATGVDILDMLIDISLGIEIDTTSLKSFDLYHTEKRFSVEMFFAKPCIIHALNNMEKLKKLPGILAAKHNFKMGDQIKEMENATQRAGYIIIEGKDDEDLAKNIKRAYDALGIYDVNGNNMIRRFDLE